MKKLLILLLAALAALLPAAALAEVDLQSFTDANAFISLMDNVTWYTCTFISYGADGAVDGPWTAHYRRDQNGMMATYLHPNGDWQSYGGGRGAYYRASDGQLYAMGFVGDAYEQLTQPLFDQNLADCGEGSRIVAQEVAADGMIHLQAEGPAEAFISGADPEALALTAFVVDPDTLLLMELNSYLLGEDGSRTLRYHCDVRVNDPVDVPDLYGQIDSAEAWRELHAIMDPGTPQEMDYVIEAPRNMPIWLRLPDGYSQYADAACTIEDPGVNPDEQGNYPETQTVYVGPAAE